MKIYTKTGDGGTTSLVNGDKVPKSHQRLEAYGTIDELNSVVGLLINKLQAHGFDGINSFLIKMQNQLFNAGSQLACQDQDMSKQLPNISTEDIKNIENEIDDLNKDLTELKEFILPGGHELACYAHLARTVCRRSERRSSLIADTGSVPETLIPYLNRLSDYFFVLARYFNHAMNHQESTWKK